MGLKWFKISKIVIKLGCLLYFSTNNAFFWNYSTISISGTHVNLISISGPTYWYHFDASIKYCYLLILIDNQYNIFTLLQILHCYLTLIVVIIIKYHLNRNKKIHIYGTLSIGLMTTCNKELNKTIVRNNIYKTYIN